MVEVRDEAAGDRIAHARKDDRDRPRPLLDGSGRRGSACHDDVGLQADQLPRERWYPIDVIAVQPKVHPQVAAIGPTQLYKPLHERGKPALCLRIAFVVSHQHADAPHAVGLLRPRHHRPRRRAPETRDELSPSCMMRKEHCEG